MFSLKAVPFLALSMRATTCAECLSKEDDVALSLERIR
jgi:hypothetical protein